MLGVLTWVLGFGEFWGGRVQGLGCVDRLDGQAGHRQWAGCEGGKALCEEAEAVVCTWVSGGVGGCLLPTWLPSVDVVLSLSLQAYTIPCPQPPTYTPPCPPQPPG